MVPPVRLRSLHNYDQLPYDFFTSLVNPKGGPYNGRKVANNTWVFRNRPFYLGDDKELDGWALQYHSTYIVTTHRIEGSDDFIILNTGGWRTSTTKYRIGLVLPRSIGLWSEDGVWLIRLNDDYAMYFRDRMRIGFRDNDPDQPYLITPEETD